MSGDIRTFELTGDEVNAILTGLYERADETRRYVTMTTKMIHAHDGHGPRCCSAGAVDHWRQELHAFEARRDTIHSAIKKLEEPQ